MFVYDIKTIRIRWERYAAHTVEMRYGFNILVGEHGKKEAIW
jgi:hypothetical protein